MPRENAIKKGVFEKLLRLMTKGEFIKIKLKSGVQVSGIISEMDGEKVTIDLMAKPKSKKHASDEFLISDIAEFPSK